MHQLLFPPLRHDHRACVERMLERARAICAAKGVRLTALRERVLREIASSHTALGAYEIIDRLGRDGRRLAPISVYRIIEVLSGAGLVHRLESRNAYFACGAEHGDARPLLVLLCEDCGRVAEAEAPGAWQAIADITHACRFEPGDTVLEVKGRCIDCTGGNLRKN